MCILVAMEISIHKHIGSLLGPVHVGIFMVELKRTILPILREHMSPWKRHVDDTISFIKEESIEHVSSKLNVSMIT